MVRKKLHQKDLAEQLNLDQRTISSYCTNKSFPDLDTLS
ncbi:MAG: helix-turn-helix transcriptional regulator, partial [Longicatena sp.]